MRKKKRLWICLAAALLLLSCALPAAAVSTELRVVAPQAMPAVGDEFTVTLQISGNPGLHSLQATLRYDDSALECTQIERGPLLQTMLSAENPYAESAGGAVIAAAALDAQIADGTIAAFRFRVLAEGAEVPRLLTDVLIGDGNGDPYTYSVVQCDADGREIGVPDVEKPDESSESGADDPSEVQSGKADEEAGKPGEQTGSGTAKPEDGEKKQPDAGGETEAAPAFPDIAGHWGAAYIAKAAELGLFTGFEDGSFRPDGTVTRGQFVTALWRMAGKPATAVRCPFADVPAGAWYADSVGWAFEKGYVNGRSDTVFDPDGTISRQEAMKILFCFAGGSGGMEILFTDIYDNDFADSGEIAAWAKPAMYWGYYNGIIRGKTATTLCPTETATRAELAKILVVYAETFGTN